ncbi:MAG: PKD domain-containing protein, partial [Solirubrobacterales bacterium]
MRPDISAAGAFAIAVWQFDGATESRIESAVHSGGGWSSPVNVTDPGEESEYFPRVAANAKGEAVAVWQHCYTGEIIPCFENKGKYVVKASVRRGGTWTMPVTVSSGTENAVKLQTAIDANGNAVVVWEDSEPVALDIHAAKLPNPGTTWTADMLSEPAREAGEPQVAFDGAGNATAIWHSHTSMSNYRVESSVLPAAMTEWPAPQTVYAPTGSFDAFEPQIAVDSAGGAVAIWRLQGPSGDTVQSSVRSGSTWSAPVNVSAGGQEVREPGLAIDPLGDAVAAWRRSNGSNKIVQGAELAPGGSWTAPEDLSAVGQDAVEPDVAIDGKGNAVVVWRTDGANKVAQASSLFALRLQSLSIPTTGTAGTPVSFSVSPLDIWSGVTTSWNFGDGATGSGTAPSHTYAKAGSYTVTVTGTDALGNAASASGTITV